MPRADVRDGDAPAPRLEAQKQRWLPGIAAGELRLQAFAVTEPTAGSDTTKIQTRAKRTQDGYVVNGQKVWTSRALTRT